MSESTGQMESPFVDVRSFEMPAAGVARTTALSSPFVEAFALEAAERGGDSSGAARRVLVSELYDDELDDALYELVGEVAALEGRGVGTAALQLRLAPLAAELEAMIQRAADAFGPRDPAAFTEAEIDDVVSRLAPQHPLAPAFENFFGKLKKVVGRVAKGAVSLAKKGVEVATKLGLGPILEKLKGLVRPLLQRVLQAAIDRLPAPLRPVATKLAAHLPALLRAEAPGDGLEQRAVDVSGIQRELDEQIADRLLGGGDVESESEAATWGERAGGEPALPDLDAARERFVAELEQLGDGGDPGPAVERFVPAILPALKLGISVIGRKRVVGALAGLVTKLIRPFVGPEASSALSTALVDAGLNLLGLEISDGDRRRTASAAVAAAVEDTVRQVAALPESVVESEMLLEASVVRAFEQAAAANLPPVLPDAVYRRRPDLAETDARRGTWIPFPIRGPRRYKKFSRVVQARITPRAAMAIPTYGAAPLSEFLQEQLGLEPGEELDANVHLYEAVAGTVLGEVARLEANGEGAAELAEFHPLTPEAAALLVREPGLGRPVSAAGLAAPRNLSVGDRFFRIAVPGRRVAAFARPGAKGRAARRTGVQAVLDFPGARIRLYLYVSERRAQELAAMLRKEGHAGAVATQLKAFIDRGLKTAASGHASGRVRLVHEALPLEEARGAALGRLPRAAVQAWVGRIGEWALVALTEFLEKESARFISTTEDAQEGVTVVITLENPPGLAALRNAVAGRAAPGAPEPGGAPAAVKVDVIPGFANG